MSSAEKIVWTIADRAKNRIIKHCVENYPNEACGILLSPSKKPQHVVKAHPTKNTTFEDPARRYLIDPWEFLTVDNMAGKSGLYVCGFYHSHPDHSPVPSDHDRNLAWESYLYLIISVKDGKFDQAKAWMSDHKERRLTEVQLQGKFAVDKSAISP
jgi:proteasome lid subunit RPN8/RPN11